MTTVATPKAPKAKAASGAPLKPREQLTGTFGDEGDPAVEARWGQPSKADQAGMKGQARGRDQAYAQAYKAGQADAAKPASKGPTGSGKGSDARFHPTGLIPGGRPLVSGGGAVDEGAGFLLGLFVYALGVSYLRGGTAGVRSWLAAKFLNRTTAPPAPTPAATGPIGSPQYFAAFPGRGPS